MTGCIAQTSLLFFSEFITPWPGFSGEAVALGLWAWQSLFAVSMEDIKDTVHV